VFDQAEPIEEYGHVVEASRLLSKSAREATGLAVIAMPVGITLDRSGAPSTGTDLPASIQR
jgi:hypothetical protein